GCGTFATLQRGHRAEACVLAEPSSGSVVVANGGSLTFRLEVPGRPTHGATRSRGVNAVEKLAGLLPVLRDLEARRNADPDPLLAHLEVAYPLSIGVVRAGDWASTVPDLAVAEGRYGVRLGESLEDAKAEFENAVAEACAGDPGLAANPVRVSCPRTTRCCRNCRRRWPPPVRNRRSRSAARTARICGCTRRPGCRRCSTGRGRSSTPTPTRSTSRWRSWSGLRRPTCCWRSGGAA